MLGVIAAQLLAAGLAHAEPDVGALQSRELDETSGLAVSRRDASVLWALNDSGGLPALYRLDAQGRDLGRVDVPQAMNLDWEDLAAFEWRGEPALLIGDVGDNYSARDPVSLYAVRDPGRSGGTALLWKLDFRYENGPRDCEALAVDPLDGDILLISKRERPPVLYRLAMPKDASEKTAVARRLGAITTIPKPVRGDRRQRPRDRPWLDLPTALDISRDGRLAVIVTPRDAWLYERRGREPWLDVFARAPRLLRLPDLPQIEAGAFDAGARALFVGSEREAPNFARVPISPPPRDKIAAQPLNTP